MNEMDRKDLRVTCWSCPGQPKMSPDALTAHLPSHGKIQAPNRTKKK